MRKDITFLASDECEGRGVSTKGINLAADYIAKQFQERPPSTAQRISQEYPPVHRSNHHLRGRCGQQISQNCATLLGLNHTNSARGKTRSHTRFGGRTDTVP